MRELEALSHRLEHEETTHHALHPHASPSKYKPKAPLRRFAEREPEKAAQLAARDAPAAADVGEAMDLDADDYVIDTYVRETLLPDSAGNLPTATGSVGYLVLAAEDEDADVVPVRQLEDEVAQIGIALEGQRVELLGAVQGHRGDSVDHREAEVLPVVGDRDAAPVAGSAHACPS